MRGSCWHRFGGGCWMGCSSGRLPMILFGVVAWAWWLGPEHDRSVTQGKAWWRASVCLRVLISSWYCASSVSQHCEALLVKWLGCSHRGRIFRRVWLFCEWAVSSSSSVVTPSALHSYVKRRFSGPPFPPPSDSGNPPLAFEGSGLSFLLLASLVWYSILLPTLPLEREIGPTVVNICLDWTGGGVYFSRFLWSRRVGSR
jgi:hypothetical protein